MLRTQDINSDIQDYRPNSWQDTNTVNVSVKSSFHNHKRTKYSSRASGRAEACF